MISGQHKISITPKAPKAMKQCVSLQLAYNGHSNLQVRVFFVWFAHLQEKAVAWYVNFKIEKFFYLQ